ncbi:hypothetical protein [Roseibacillus persicicus]|uniref:hypothetical protein n=1 Tax=Roseibacillus persicicus TaxID=454148 RepID=UPI00280CA1CB|nr:hypothetical protein [Roseibacillus persicicus]MDQ8191931.1 hypothetical protein [Roseibacillus persicicus]
MIILTSLALFGSSLAHAQRKGRVGDRGLAQREFQSVKAEFDAWKLSVLESGLLKISESREGEPLDFYTYLVSAVHEERLTEEEFSNLGQQYITAVIQAGKQGAASMTKELESLRLETVEAADGEMNAATATLDINREQINAQELMWFGILTDKLSKGKRATIERKQSALVALEQKAKSDQKLDDREREKLREDASEILEELMEALAS